MREGVPLQGHPRRVVDRHHYRVLGCRNGDEGEKSVETPRGGSGSRRIPRWPGLSTTATRGSPGPHVDQELDLKMKPSRPQAEGGRNWREKSRLTEAAGPGGSEVDGREEPQWRTCSTSAAASPPPCAPPPESRALVLIRPPFVRRGSTERERYALRLSPGLRKTLEKPLRAVRISAALEAPGNTPAPPLQTHLLQNQSPKVVGAQRVHVQAGSHETS